MTDKLAQRRLAKQMKAELRRMKVDFLAGGGAPEDLAGALIYEFVQIVEGYRYDNPRVDGIYEAVRADFTLLDDEGVEPA